MASELPVEVIESAHSFSDLPPIVYMYARCRVRAVLDIGVFTERLSRLPIPKYMVTVIAEAIHEGQRSAIGWKYRDGFDKPVRPLDWHLD